MLHGTIFNNNSHRNGLPNQSNLAQLHLHCESSLKIVPCNISFKVMDRAKVQDCCKLLVVHCFTFNDVENSRHLEKLPLVSSEVSKLTDGKVKSQNSHVKS